MESLKAFKIDWFRSLFTLTTWLSLYKAFKVSYLVSYRFHVYTTNDKVLSIYCI